MKTVVEKYVAQHADFHSFYLAEKENRGFHGYIINGLFDHHQWAFYTFTDNHGRDFIALVEWNKIYKEVITRNIRVVKGRFKKDGFRYAKPIKEINNFRDLNPELKSAVLRDGRRW
jgi:hypothetical protein